MPEPIEVTLYDPETNEKVKTFTRSFIPWEILKTALRIQKTLDTENLTEADVDELASLVVAAFGDQFSIAEASKGMDLGEMLTVMNTIITRADQLIGGNKRNPTKAAR